MVKHFHNGNLAAHSRAHVFLLEDIFGDHLQTRLDVLSNTDSAIQHKLGP